MPGRAKRNGVSTTKFYGEAVEVVLHGDGLCLAGQNGVSTIKIQIVTIVLVPNDEVLGGFPVTS